MQFNNVFHLSHRSLLYSITNSNSYWRRCTCYLTTMKQLNLFEEPLLVYTTKEWRTSTLIVNRLGLHRNTVGKWISRYENEGTLQTRNWPGGPCCTTQEVDRAIVQVVEHPITTTVVVKNNLNLTSNLNFLKKNYFYISCSFSSYIKKPNKLYIQYTVKLTNE